MWVTISQPQFMPQFFMLERVARADTFVVMMEAQFDRYHARVKIQSKNGPEWFGLQVAHGGHNLMNKVCLHDTDRWVVKAVKQLTAVYGRSMYWKQYSPYVIDFIERIVPGSSSMSDVGWLSYKFAMDMLGIETVMIKSLDVVPVRPTSPNEWISELCKRVGGKYYSQGKTSMDSYFAQSYWDDRGISLYYQEFTATVQAQGWPEFDAGHSWLDFLFHVGVDGCQRLLDITKGDEVVGTKSTTVKKWAAP